MDDNFDLEEAAKSGKVVYVVGYLIYVMAIGFAELMFIGMMRNIFAGWNPLFIFFAAAGAVAAGLTVAVIPWAKSRWFATSDMNNAGWIFWGLEILVLILNTLLAFDIANGVTDSWVSWWRHVSPASPILAVVTWGILIQMHPSFKARQSVLQFWGRFTETVGREVMGHLKSQEIRDYIHAETKTMVDQVLRERFGVLIDSTASNGGKTAATERNGNGHREYASETENSTSKNPKRGRG